MKADLLLCAYCNKPHGRCAGEINRARQHGLNLYCNREHANLGAIAKRKQTFSGFCGHCECGHHAWASAGKWRIVLVSPSDAEILRIYPMYSLKTKKSRTAYVYFHKENCYDQKYLHRELKNPSDGEEVDHHNHDGLDNTRGNLRVASKSQNMANTRRQKRAKSKYRGIRFHHGAWLAQISIDGRAAHLGSFDTEENAARAYDVAAKQQYGEFAQLNFKENA